MFYVRFRGISVPPSSMATVRGGVLVDVNALGQKFGLYEGMQETVAHNIPGVRLALFRKLLYEERIEPWRVLLREATDLWEETAEGTFYLEMESSELRTRLAQIPYEVRLGQGVSRQEARLRGEQGLQEDLPIACLDTLTAAQKKRLQGLGLFTLHDFRQIPRSLALSQLGSRLVSEIGKYMEKETLQPHKTLLWQGSILPNQGQNALFTPLVTRFWQETSGQYGVSHLSLEVATADIVLKKNRTFTTVVNETQRLERALQSLYPLGMADDFEKISVVFNLQRSVSQQNGLWEKPKFSWSSQIKPEISAREQRLAYFDPWRWSKHATH